MHLGRHNASDGVTLLGKRHNHLDVVTDNIILRIEVSIRCQNLSDAWADMSAHETLVVNCGTWESVLH